MPSDPFVRLAVVAPQAARDYAERIDGLTDIEREIVATRVERLLLLYEQAVAAVTPEARGAALKALQYARGRSDVALRTGEALAAAERWEFLSVVAAGVSALAGLLYSFAVGFVEAAAAGVAEGAVRAVLGEDSAPSGAGGGDDGQ